MATLQGNEANDKYKRGAAWAVENIPEGERIFNCNWDDFPKLFFYDTKHSYVYGLDPHYLYTKNPELSKLIPDLTERQNQRPRARYPRKIRLALYLFRRERKRRNDRQMSRKRLVRNCVSG